MIDHKYSNFAIKNICKAMHTMFYEFGCEHCPFAYIKDDNKKCSFNTIPQDWELNEEGEILNEE